MAPIETLTRNGPASVWNSSAKTTASQPFAELRRRVQGVEPRRQDDELVPAPATDDVAGPYVLVETAHELAQDVVARGVAMGVVDPLEPVEVDDEERRGTIAVQHAGVVALQDGLEGGAVQRAGERIGGRPQTLTFERSRVVPVRRPADRRDREQGPRRQDDQARVRGALACRQHEER